MESVREKIELSEKTAFSSGAAGKRRPGAADGTRGTHCMRGRRRFAGARRPLRGFRRGTAVSGAPTVAPPRGRPTRTDGRTAAAKRARTTTTSPARHRRARSTLSIRTRRVRGATEAAAIYVRQTRKHGARARAAATVFRKNRIRLTCRRRRRLVRV